MNLNLSVEIDGTNVPLAKCDWVEWGACGCPWGVTLAGDRGTHSVITEEDAWKQFYDCKRDRDRAERIGVRMELMTHERWSAEVCDRMKVRCTHTRATQAVLPEVAG